MSAERRIFAAEPWLRPTDLHLLGAPRWSDIDEIASEWLGHTCVALPSVRVGLGWAFEHLGFQRHRDHVLVPRYMGRCILNAVSRVVFPVQHPTAETRAALVVDQYGRRQDLDGLRPEFERRGWLFVEDSPYGIGEDEAPGGGSMGRFIGLSKVLPVVNGALLTTENKALREHVLRCREERSAFALPVWLTMLAMRRRYVGSYSNVADAAYELYPAVRGGSSLLRGNLAVVLGRIEVFVREGKSRLDAVEEALGASVLMPDRHRLGYVVPYFPGGLTVEARATFRRHGFSDALLHVDVAGNMLSPEYIAGLLIPINPRIPRGAFNALLDALRHLGQAPHSAGSLALT